MNDTSERGLALQWQVLDGVAVSHSMQMAANEAFRGRLMATTLTRHLGHPNFHLLDRLDLSGMQLLSLGDVFASHAFPCLSRLTLDHNSLTQVSAEDTSPF